MTSTQLRYTFLGLGITFLTCSVFHLWHTTWNLCGIHHYCWKLRLEKDNPSASLLCGLRLPHPQSVIHWSFFPRWPMDLNSEGQASAQKSPLVGTRRLYLSALCPSISLPSGLSYHLTVKRKQKLQRISRRPLFKFHLNRVSNNQNHWREMVSYWKGTCLRPSWRSTFSKNNWFRAKMS